MKAGRVSGADKVVAIVVMAPAEKPTMPGRHLRNRGRAVLSASQERTAARWRRAASG
jgi:hypothetical protein